ncbi:MAG TPA: flagellar hook assembly protein FlgD [Acetobacteraceae bacterium]|nr:flagellar hook assembly protein FlgD [Acetobacteraceae bacterium]
MSASLATAAAASQAVANANAQRPRLAGDFNTFLSLLTTQLRNQSPTEPLDANQMTAQLVQFASVEQLISMNQNLDRLLALEQVSQLTAAAPLMGRTVEVESDRVALQEGRAALRLPTAGAAASARVVVTDEAGRTLNDRMVRLGSMPTTWRWDGRDMAGRQMPDGAYRVTVTGVTAGGGAASAPFTVLGRATSAERADGALRLRIGALAVGFDRLRGVAD